MILRILQRTICIWMVLGLNLSLMAQNQPTADSLEQIFLSLENPVTELHLLERLIVEQMDSDKKFNSLSIYVKSQLKRAVRLYEEFAKS